MVPQLTPDQALQMLSQMIAKAPMPLEEHLKGQEAVKVLRQFLNAPISPPPKGDNDG